jgi:putative ABC transport system permease protein
MRALRSSLHRMLSRFTRARREREFSAELDAHLQAHIDDNLRAGMTLDEARRTALLFLGGVDMTSEQHRDQRSLPLVEDCAREVRQAFGRLRRSPAFTAAAVLSLALAIGANVSIFAVVERVVLHPLPYPDSGRLVLLDFGLPSRNMAAGFTGVSTRQYFHYAEHARTLSALAVYWASDFTVTGRGTPERIRVAMTTPSLASVLHVAPAVGAWLPNDKPRGPAPTAVLSHGLWVRRYGADPGILGKTITLDGTPTTVVGVMPAAFAFPDARVDAWIPVPFSPTPSPIDDAFNYFGVARLRDGVSLDTTRAEINQLTQSLEAAAPDHGYGALVSTALTLQDATVGPIAATLWILLASAGVVLLVACANIANLFLVRSEARQQEISIRRALGAGSGGIAGYFLAESTLLSIAGGALGLLSAWYGVRLLVAFGPTILPRLEEVRLAPIHMAFTLALTLAAAVVFAALPLARLGRSRVTVQDGARGATPSRRSHRTRQALMAGQVALALVLLVASGLLLRSFARLRAVDPGFNPASALTFQIGLPRSDYPAREQAVRTHESILARLRALPGVTSASAVNCVPLSGLGFCGSAVVFKEGESLGSGADAARPVVAMRSVAADFFDTMGIPIVLGRNLTPADFRGDVLSTVVNDTAARLTFPGQNPLGKRIALSPHRLGPNPVWFTIVGVVKTTPTLTLDEPRPVAKMYVPMDKTHDFWQPTEMMTYVLRTSVPPAGLTSAARSSVSAVDPNLALARVRALQDYVDAAAAPRAFTMILILIAATTALLLGVVGIYGVMSYVVSQRTKEIGVRIALGAEPGSVMRMIVRQGGLVALGGVAVGLVASLAGGSVIASLLYDVSPRDPQVFAVTTLALLGVTLVACWLPARRAASVDPLIALRAE